MNLSFQARSVDCRSLIGGDILQVSIGAAPPGQDEEQRTLPCVLIGRNFEFSGAPTVEWHDGEDYDGGAAIRSIGLRREKLVLRLDQSREIVVSFSLPDREFDELRSFVKRILVGHARFCEEGASARGQPLN